MRAAESEQQERDRMRIEQTIEVPGSGAATRTRPIIDPKEIRHEHDRNLRTNQ
jgi:hypothetical protein